MSCPVDGLRVAGEGVSDESAEVSVFHSDDDDTAVVGSSEVFPGLLCPLLALNAVEALDIKHREQESLLCLELLNLLLQTSFIAAAQHTCEISHLARHIRRCLGVRQGC